jgi:hypothetical protein
MTNNKQKRKIIITQETKKIVKKGEDMSDIDLYNLCVLNRMSEIEDALQDEPDMEG